MPLWNKYCKLTGMRYLVLIWFLSVWELMAQGLQDKKTLDDYFYDAMTERLKENYQQSNDLFEKCLSIDPDNDVFYFKIAQNYFELKDYENSLLYLEKAQQLNPDNKWYQVLFIEIKIKQHTDSKTLYKLINDFETKAKNKYLIKDLRWKVVMMRFEEQSKPEETPKPEDKTSELKKLWQQKQYDKLVKACGDALEKMPDNAEVYLYMAKAYTALEKYDYALEYLDLGIDFTTVSKPLLKAFYQQYIDIYTALKQNKKAKKYRQKLKKL